ncbi:hypothetical protein IFM61606_07876 [Aspergillus udagawae]|nr:hypothetical protein IFM5058_09734 [Aspergillus udagawae]GFG27817.1 hypothetical protein IFM61606_07876 [Aspergillus udagawae]
MAVAMASAQSRFDLPGFSLPPNFTPGTVRPVMFPNGLDGYFISRLNTHREIVMMRAMNSITDKADRDKKAHTKHVVAFDVGVVKSDVAIPEELRQALIEAVRPLEEIPKEQKDYHPGTDNKVVDLVHPSLFPVIYGRTRILPDRLIDLEAFAKEIGEGNVLPVRPEEESVTAQSDYQYRWFERDPHRPYSLRFQWLPCDVYFGPNDGNECRIASYINNLRPNRHRALYYIIEKILTRTIPMWNKTLTLLQDEYKRIEYYKVEYEDHSEPEPEAADEDEEDSDEFCELNWEWQRGQPIKQPEPGSFVPHTLKNQVNLRQEYAERGLQVIVKLAYIELTPEKPDENITESTLAFRQRASTGDVGHIKYEQSRHGFLQQVFGFGPDVDGHNECNITQLLGSVETRQGRLLTFPNILQHRAAPFRLADPSKSGHRKILAFFLVDPHLSIISSANVPPQQEDWWRERQELVGRLLGEKLPPELQDIVKQDFDAQPITMEEAKQYRKELMEERSCKLEAQNEKFEIDSFDLCEH